MNWMEKDQKYDVDIYLSTASYKDFFGHRNSRKEPLIYKAKPVWMLRDLTYNLEHEESNS